MKGAALSLLAIASIACGGAQHTAPPAGAGPVARSSADALVKRVEQAYRELHPLTCRFRQTAYNKTFGLPVIHDGTLHVERPGTVRWDYFSRRDKTHVIQSQVWNGRTIRAVSGNWNYRVSQSRSTLPISVAFLAGSGELSRAFDARLLTGSTCGNPSDSVLELTPKNQSATFKALVLVVDPTTSWVKRSVVTTTSGDAVEFTFYRINTASSPPRDPAGR